MAQPAIKKDVRHKIIGHRKRAYNRWNCIKQRCNDQTNKNKSYKNIKFLLPKKEFIDWFMINDFENCSVDRINNDGDYEMSNIRLITISENSQRLHRLSSNNTQICCRCEKRKSLELFSKNKRNKSTGKSTTCKKCDALRKRIERKNKNKNEL